MFIRLKSRRGQNTAEYAILIGVIVAAAIAMQIYIRRGMQARVKEAVDFSLTADDNVGNGIFNMKQYEPYYQASNITTESWGKRTESLEAQGGTYRDVKSDAVSRYGNQVYGNYAAGNI